LPSSYIKRTTGQGTASHLLSYCVWNVASIFHASRSNFISRKRKKSQSSVGNTYMHYDEGIHTLVEYSTQLNSWKVLPTTSRWDSNVLQEIFSCCLGKKNPANIVVSKETRCVRDVITDNTHIVPENYKELSLSLHSEGRYIIFLNSVCMNDVPKVLKSNSVSRSRTQAVLYSFWKRVIRSGACLTFSCLQLTATEFRPDTFGTSIIHTKFKKILFYWFFPT